MPQARHEQRELLWLEGEVWQHGRLQCPTAERARYGECKAEEAAVKKMYDLPRPGKPRGCGDDVRFHELRGDDADLVTHYLQLASQPLRARTGFHTNDSACSTLKEREQCIAAKLQPLDHRTASVEPDHVEQVLTEIDAINRGVSRHVSDHVSSSFLPEP